MEVLQSNIKPIGYVVQRLIYKLFEFVNLINPFHLFSQLNSPLSIYEKSFFNELANLSANNLSSQNKPIEKSTTSVICAHLPKEDYNRIALISVHGDPGM